MQFCRHLPLITPGFSRNLRLVPLTRSAIPYLSPGSEIFCLACTRRPVPDCSQRVAQAFQPAPAQAKPLWPFGATPQNENLLSGRPGGSPLGGTFTVNITLNHRWFTPKDEKSPFGKGGFRGIWVFTVKPAATRNQPQPASCKTPRPHYNKVCLPGHGF
jgi:hypothetical protein